MKIKDFNNYNIYQDGSITRGSKALKGGLDRYGYKLFTLSQQGKRKTVYSHRLVAVNYIANPYNLPVVNHLDGDKQNNLVSNLEWTTVSGNTKHAYKIGSLNQVGENNNASKHNDDLVLFIKEGYDGGNIAAYATFLQLPYSVVYSYIKNIRRVEGSTTIPSGSTPKQVEAHNNEQSLKI